MSKCEVIRKTGSTWRIATPLKEDRVTATVNTQRKCAGEVPTCGSWDILAHRQTDRQTDGRTDTLITIVAMCGPIDVQTHIDHISTF